MTGHRAGISETKINVAVAIHVGEVRTFRLFDENRKRARPADHPQHRHAAMQGLARTLVELIRFGMVRVKELFFLIEELYESGSVEGLGHDWRLFIFSFSPNTALFRPADRHHHVPRLN